MAWIRNGDLWFPQKTPKGLRCYSSVQPRRFILSIWSFLQETNNLILFWKRSLQTKLLLVLGSVLSLTWVFSKKASLKWLFTTSSRILSTSRATTCRSIKVKNQDWKNFAQNCLNKIYARENNAQIGLITNSGSHSYTMLLLMPIYS